MKIKNSIYNISFGLLNLVITTAFAIAIPKLLILNFGSESNGFLASITQIFSYFIILEAGIGLAAIQALYKPVSENDRESINKIMAATNKFYKKISCWYMFGVVIVAVVYPLIIKTSIPNATVISLILISGTVGAINLLFIGRYRILLEAEGKNYILLNLATVVNLLINLSRIILLNFEFNLIIVQSSILIFSLAQLLFINYYIKTHYAWIDLSVTPEKYGLSQKKSVLIHQISGLIFNNTDIIILTFFTNLKIVSVYAIYSMLFNILKSLMASISNSVIFILGQLYNTKNKKFLNYFEIYEVYYTASAFGFSLTLFIFLESFLKLYTQGIEDINYIDGKLSLLFTLITILLISRTPSRQIIDIAGHFKETQKHSIIESILNLFFSLLFVVFFGIYGVLFGTIVALLYRNFKMINYSNKIILNRTPFNTIKIWIVNVSTGIVIYYLNSFVEISLNSYFDLLRYSFLYFLTIMILLFLINSFLFKSSREILHRLVEYIHIKRSIR